MAVESICSEYATCQKCSFGLGVSVSKPPLRVFYRGNTKGSVFLVGEGPGRDEIKVGKPYVGKAGVLLGKILKHAGINEEDCFITNSFVCSDDGIKKPTDEVLIACRDRLFRMIEAVKPKVIICLGAYAWKAVSALNKIEPVTSYLDKMLNINGVPTFVEYHPAYLLRNPAAKIDAAKRWTKIGAFINKINKKIG